MTGRKTVYEARGPFYRCLFTFSLVTALAALVHRSGVLSRTTIIAAILVAGALLPGLLFGWLRAMTGSLIAPLLSHGSGNVFSLFLVKSLL